MGSLALTSASTPLQHSNARSSDRARSAQPAASREWDRRQRHA
jgi:hypothetical protein